MEPVSDNVTPGMHPGSPLLWVEVLHATVLLDVVDEADADVVLEVVDVVLVLGVVDVLEVVDVVLEVVVPELRR